MQPFYKDKKKKYKFLEMKTLFNRNLFYNLQDSHIAACLNISVRVGMLKYLFIIIFFRNG
jgi:hypothetical protein